MSERLPPIPTPPAQVWRQVRLHYAPVLVFVAGVIAAFVIWTRWVAPPTLVGEAEAVRTEIRSAQSGRLSTPGLALLQPVTAGQTVGHVIPTEPKVVDASLAVVRAEIEAMRSTLEPIVGQQRMALDYERLQLDWMSRRVDLALLRGQLAQAEVTLTRIAALHQSKMVPDERYDEARQARDTLDAQVKAQTELVQRLEPAIRRFAAEAAATERTPAEALRAAIKHKEEELRLLEAQLAPIPLLAPIDGVITLLIRRSGEVVAAGEPILQISATRSERIIGFLRQPLPLEPKPGMTVEVRTRTFQRKVALARLMQVGEQLEPISPTLLSAMRLPVSNIPTEFGLRVHVTAPPGLTLRPGEHVDLIIRD